MAIPLSSTSAEFYVEPFILVFRVLLVVLISLKKTVKCCLNSKQKSFSENFATTTPAKLFKRGKNKEVK